MAAGTLLNLQATSALSLAAGKAGASPARGTATLTCQKGSIFPVTLYLLGYFLVIVVEHVFRSIDRGFHSG